LKRTYRLGITVAALGVGTILPFADMPRPVCGQDSPPASREGAIICCNQIIGVRGNWFGALHNANCEEYARTNAEVRRSLCAMQCLSKEAKKKYCGKEDCKENPTPPGSVYAGVPGARTRSAPDKTSQAIGSPVWGGRLVYQEVKKVNGNVWYKVARPSHLAGWISEEEVFCELPPPPPPRPPDHSCKKNPKVPGALFAGSSTTVVGVVYSDATGDSQVIGTQPNGTRVVYKEVRENKGETWFHVFPPGRPSGWMRGSDLVCSRPGDPAPGMTKPLDSSLATERPTAAIASAGRG
jgi:hypothetical protein